MGMFFTQEFWFVFLVLILSGGLIYAIIDECLSKPKKRVKLKRKYKRLLNKRGK